MHIEDIKEIDLEKRVIVIGAGPSGLAAARWLRDYGFTPIIIEATNQIGGLWHYGTWPSMRTNLSKFSLFSDLQLPMDAPIFLSPEQMLNYLNQYAFMFSLHAHTIFDTRVTSVTKDKEDRWHVTVQEKDQTQTTIECPYVVVASGFFADPFIPQLPNRDIFEGKIWHSNDYKNLSSEEFNGKHIAVVGGSFSATDIIPELIKQGARVTHIVQHPYWILPRTINGLPLDLFLASYKRHNRQSPNEQIIKTQDDNLRANQYLAQFCPQQTELSHPLYINPNSEQPPHVAISDHYLNHIGDNLEIIKGRISALNTNGYEINGTQRATDAILFCTGYKPNLRFLSPQILQALFADPNDMINPYLLYKGTLSPTIANMGFVGMYKGPYFTIMELQARLLAMLFAGQLSIDQDAIREDIAKQQLNRQQEDKVQFPHGDFLGFADDLAGIIGSNPLAHLKVNDHLYAELKEQPVTAAQYRLFGPKSKPLLYSQQSTEIIAQRITVLNPSYTKSLQRLLKYRF